MASAQVLPSSRKQEHLEAGKRRLEEFRKKKAAERAKKAASTTHSHSSDVSLNDKHQLETENVRVTDGAGTSNGPDPYVKIINNSKTEHMSNDFRDTKSKEDNGSLKVSAVVNPISSEDFVAKISAQNSLQSKTSEGSLLGSSLGLSSFHEDSTQSTLDARGSGLEFGQNLQGNAEYREPLISEQRSSGFPGNFSAPTSNNGVLLRLNEDTSVKKHGFYSTKQNEDFAALEQHIEDLTQEKFSLQRALEASRTFAESLAAENSSLTDSYNQQRSVVNQLKNDMEQLQEEIKAQLAELEAFKKEYANARLECNAADERASILASEVIGLEEKALRLRSNELKLERRLENSQAEISSFKKKMSSLEKERQDFQSTIEALQEEKNVLQFKLRKASASGKSIDLTKNPASKKDMSTSTDDLVSMDAVTNDKEMNNDASSLSLLPEDGQFEAASLYIPPDQMRMIQNINSLISELTLEKEELAQALSSESSQSSKLKELNNELSRKLEAQTQRLELLTAQSMASEHIPVRQYESKVMHENTPYADEGDEVVERVLGWIMKLFPGGPSSRRTYKRISY